ncbi:glycerophosphodiester phosphodiesterase [Flavobacterium sp. ARAG 55.4]|uniref:Glycerophosphodiester phosphodiesterase family protein n=1 Tax=Flavobacterium plantiphilum TaxID=3163297 RepID=A0ABW8XU08_9FLAO
MLKIGHRGAKGYEPENTLKSFQKAIDLHVDRIELDVHLSSDNEIIVIHDETVDRVTDHTGFVKNFSLPQLKRFLIDKKYHIPTLSQVLNLINQRCEVNIEIKSYDATEKVVDLIEKYVEEKKWNYNQFIISSFDWTALQQVSFLNSNIRIGVLTENDLDLAFAFAKTIQARSVHPYFHLLTAEKTVEMQNAGFEVYPWTVNEIEDIKEMKSFNVNGIISDFPDRI